MRTVKDILIDNRKPFNAISPQTKVIDALHLLKAYDVNYLVVIVNGGYAGIFSEKDYSRNVILRGRSSIKTPVCEVMTIDLPMVALDDSAEYCMKLMDAAHTHYLLAFDEQEFVGVISMDDLIHEVLISRDMIFEEDFAEIIF